MKNILLGITGSIAEYRSAICRFGRCEIADSYVEYLSYGDIMRRLSL